LRAFTDSMTVNKIIKTVSLLGNKSHRNDDEDDSERQNNDRKDGFDLDRLSSSIVSDLDLEEKPSLISEERYVFVVMPLLGQVYVFYSPI
jgi:hypothetical protein